MSEVEEDKEKLLGHCTLSPFPPGTPTPFATSSPPLKKTSSTGDKVEETVVEPFNPFGLPIPEFHSNDKNGVAESAGPASVEAQTHRAGSTIGGQNDWKAFFPSATSTKTSTIPAEEPYDRLIDLRDDDDERDKTLEHATGDQPAEQMQQVGWQSIDCFFSWTS